MNRALRAATLGVALLIPVTLTACSAGQVTQTATQERDKTGSMAQVGDITVRQVQLVNPRGGAYDAGDDAEVRMAIVNTGEETDTLTSVEGEGFGSAEITGVATSATSGGTPVGSVDVASPDEIELPPDTTIFIGEYEGDENPDDLRITLTDLDESLTVGQSVTLVLTFETAGEVTVRATAATPEREIRREEGFDFQPEEGGGEGGAAEGAGDTARERESDVDESN